LGADDFLPDDRPAGLSAFYFADAKKSRALQSKLFLCRDAEREGHKGALPRF
jgi:hypothetical protein